MGARRIDRLGAVNQARFARGQDHRDCDYRAFEVVMALRNKRRLERSGIMVITVIEGVIVFGRCLDAMPMHGWRT